MKIISWNVNGLRAVYKKGFEATVTRLDPDILCLQEIRCSEDDLQKLPVLADYHVTYNHAQKKGYSGVAIYSKNVPLSVVQVNLTKKFGEEARGLLATFDTFCILAVYIPNGGRKKENMEYKLEVYQELLTYIEENKDKNIILAGDFNIAHEAIDLARPDDNNNNTMFTPVERNQITKLIDIGYTDTFRFLYKDRVQYSWWANWAHSREKNIGWRIDYIFLPNTLVKDLREAFIMDNVFGSDHCPVGIDIYEGNVVS